MEKKVQSLFRDPDYATAIIGVSDDYRVVYDYNKMIEYLVNNEDMDESEAADFIDYNTYRALPYINGKRPIIMNSIID